MSPTKILLDSNILIMASQGQLDVRTALARYDELSISIVSQVEVLGFNFPTVAEEAAAIQVLAVADVLPFTEIEAQHAIAYRKLKKIKFPDAAILATARAAGADLLTQNLVDFQGRDPAVRVLSIQDL